MPVTEHPKEKALRFAEGGRKLAAAIDDAVFAELPPDAPELMLYAERIRRCSATQNIWYATDLHTADGEAFDGAGRFWQCGHKLCPYCLSKASKRNRKHLQRKMEDLKLFVGEDFRMLTLTMPNQGLPLLRARQIFNLAWSLFRKRHWFRKTIRGGVKSEEFTLTKKGYHYHAHVLAVTKWIDWDVMRTTWTESVAESFRQHGLTLAAFCSDDLLDARSDDITRSTAPPDDGKNYRTDKRGHRTYSREGALRETAKYITKTSTWTDLTPHELLDVCRIPRFPRMFEFFGCFRQERQTDAEKQNEQPLNKTILDTKGISDASEPNGWREIARRIGYAEYLEHLEDEICEQSQMRMKLLKIKYTAATFKRCRADRLGLDARTLDRIEQVKEMRLRKNRPAITFTWNEKGHLEVLGA